MEEAQAEKDLKQLAAEISLLRESQSLRTELKTLWPSGRNVSKVEDLLKQEHAAYLAGNWPAVEGLHKEIQDEYASLVAPQSSSQQPEAANLVISQSPPQQGTSTPAGQPGGGGTRLKAGERIRAGNVAIRRFFRQHSPQILSALRVLLATILVVLLVVLGMQTLYVNATTFGAAGLFDYVALFVWGLSIDVARSTLVSLPQLTK